MKWKNALRRVRNWINPVFDPLRFARGVAGYGRFFADWQRYGRLENAGKLRWRDAYPQLHDRTSTTAIDPHYFYTNAWAMRRIVAQRPDQHVDIASQTVFASLLAAVIPVTFVDYRPLQCTVSGLTCVGGDILDLPFPERSIESLSCLHVIEHVGLGRYGDRLDPNGTINAMRAMVRVLKPGGNLFLSTPVGRPRICFNAHRIHSAPAIRAMAPELELVEFSGVTDAGQYVEKVDINAFNQSDYACGFFWFSLR